MTLTRIHAQHIVAEALRVRAGQSISPKEPVRVYDLAQHLGVEVRFASLPSLEGVFSNGQPPTAIISSLRPQGRRVYTCAHELGHWKLGDAIGLDELMESRNSMLSQNPRERAAQLFAGTLLMPKPAIVHALYKRGWEAEALIPVQVIALATLFGVGYTTFVDHLNFGLSLLSTDKAMELKKPPVRGIKSEIAGTCREYPNVHVVDLHWPLVPIDVEIGDSIVFLDAPGSWQCQISPGIQKGPNDASVEAAEKGEWNICLPNGLSVAVRISRKDYCGRAIYRHLVDKD